MLKIFKMRIVIFFILFNLNSYAQKDSVQFYYLGHSSFLIFFGNEISVLTDYGNPNAYIDYGWDSPIYDIGEFHPTIITYSHLHDDHYDSTRIPSQTKYILNNTDTIRIKNLLIYPILTSEDNVSIKNNISYLFKYKGITILHLGDCQANIINIDSLDNLNYIKENIPVDCDVVLIPIEGKSKFIPQVEKFIELIHPKIIIPMHYWSDEYKLDFLNYIESKDIANGTRYRIVKIINSRYIYTKSENNDSISVINVYPSKFNKD